MVDYVETYSVDGRRYGIEQTKPRIWSCWVGGCGIGGYPSIDQARRRLHEYAVTEQTRKRNQASRDLKEAETTLEKLGTDPFHLGKFQIETT